MSSVNYITARDLFLSHHWLRYPPYEAETFSDFTCGRIAAKDGSRLTFANVAQVPAATFAAKRWLAESLREPKAAESAPPLEEVLTVGDWVGVNSRGDAILFAPCLKSGATAVQDGAVFHGRALSWNNFLSDVRDFFHERDFTEVTTPTLAISPGTEPFLDPISVTIESDGLLYEKFLITSPEFSLKKALAAGIPRIFEIAKCFRDRESGAHHRVEFHMLEWYRSFASLAEIADDVEAILARMANSSSGTVTLQRTTMSKLFREFADFDLQSRTTLDELAAAAHSLGVRVVDGDDFNDIFHKIFLEKIEKRIDEYTKDSPLLISGYPPSMAALARIGRDGFADRFEVYWRGLEICNAFHELNDPRENMKRFEYDNASKIQSGRSTVPVDAELMAAFDSGVPPAGGIALGLERLFMAVHGFNGLTDVRPFLEPGR